MIDTKRMREFANRLNDAKLLFGSTHFEGCEYFHLPCAVLRLCDELDAANALLDEHYNEGDPDDLIPSFEEYLLQAHINKTIDENGA